MKRALLVSDAEGVQEQVSSSAKVAEQSRASNEKMTHSLNNALMTQIEHSKKSTSRDSSTPELILPEDSMNENLDLVSLGYLNTSDLQTDENLEEHEASCEQPTKSKNTMSLATLFKNSVILSPEMADEVLVLLDAMVLRLIRCEAKAWNRFKENEAGAQKKINNAKSLLAEIPSYATRQSTMQFMMEVCEFIESVLCTFESLTIKLLEAQTKELCETVRDLNTNLKSVKIIRKLPPREKKTVSQNMTFPLELICEGIFLMLFFLVMYLLFNPMFGGAFAYANVTRRFF